MMRDPVGKRKGEGILVVGPNIISLIMTAQPSRDRPVTSNTEHSFAMTPNTELSLAMTPNTGHSLAITPNTKHSLAITPNTVYWLTITKLRLANIHNGEHWLTQL